MEYAIRLGYLDSVTLLEFALRKRDWLV